MDIENDLSFAALRLDLKLCDESEVPTLEARLRANGYAPRESDGRWRLVRGADRPAAVSGEIGTQALRT